MLKKETLTFLKTLDKNNDREWFNAHKDQFTAAKENIAAFTGNLIALISKFDPDISGTLAADCVFRIYRDVRFSKNKNPYKNNLGAYIAPGGRKSTSPGYYFHFQPGHSFIAAGLHMPDSADLLKVRKAIDTMPKEFLKTVEVKSFTERFDGLHGEKLKLMPKGFPADHPQIEYLKMKSMTAHREYKDDKIALARDYPKLLAADAKALYPFISFLRSALRSGK
ncbi:MAG: DUF2461 domain-containing protein [Acidobacteriota bacterium]